MKILQIIPSLLKGGAERLVLDICQNLSTRENLEVHLVVFSDKNEYEFISSTISYSIIPSKVVPSITGKTTVNIQGLQSFIDNYKPDIIHSHLFESEMVLSQISYSNAIYFVHFHDNMKQFKRFRIGTFTSKEAITNYFERRLVLKGYRRRTTSFIGISNDAYNYMQSNLPNRYSKQLLHNAVNIKRFSEGIKDRSNNRIVIIGSLVDKKGQDLAIEVIKKLHERKIYVQLDILGVGPNYAKLKRIISDYSIDQYVILHGNVDHPEDFLNKANIYLHTASYEPFGLVLIEAMASGLPVVCTDASGNRDIINDGENGFMIWERDADLLADKIQLLLDDTILWNQMSQNAIHYSKKYDISCYVDQLLLLYQK